MFSYKILPVLALIIQNIASESFRCGPNILPCVCYTPTNDTSETAQLVCTDNGVNPLDAKTLYRIGNAISGDAYLLHIHDTSIDTIDANTFSKVTFKKIFIENNVLLTNINGSTFKKTDRTVTLAVRDNEKLDTSGLFQIAFNLGKNLTDVEFYGNNIGSFEGAFNSDTFGKLAYIRLDRQNYNPITLKDKSFAKLPALKELSLNDNTFDAIDDDSHVIDLTATKSGHVSIFLQNCGLKNIRWMFLNNSISVSVGLDLESNKLIEVPKLCERVVNNAGSCYLKGNPTIVCSCYDYYWVTALLASNSTTKNNIQGVADTLCDDKGLRVRLAACEPQVSTTTKKSI